MCPLRRPSHTHLCSGAPLARPCTPPLLAQVVVPPISDEEIKMMEAKLAFGVRGVKGIKGRKRNKHELNYVIYKKQTQMLTVVVSVANFDNSKYVGGAGVGAKPDELKGQPAKYLLGAGWVPRSTRAPTRAALRAAYVPAAAAWPH
jgi:hypothetical protein